MAREPQAGGPGPSVGLRKAGPGAAESVTYLSLRGIYHAPMSVALQMEEPRRRVSRRKAVVLSVVPDVEPEASSLDVVMAGIRAEEEARWFLYTKAAAEAEQLKMRAQEALEALKRAQIVAEELDAAARAASFRAQKEFRFAALGGYGLC